MQQQKVTIFHGNTGDKPSMAHGRSRTSDTGRVTTVRYCPLDIPYHSAQPLPDANCCPFVCSLAGRTDRGLGTPQFGTVDPLETMERDTFSLVDWEHLFDLRCIYT
jgi:hypothetical protein